MNGGSRYVVEKDSLIADCGNSRNDLLGTAAYARKESDRGSMGATQIMNTK